MTTPNRDPRVRALEALLALRRGGHLDVEQKRAALALYESLPCSVVTTLATADLDAVSLLRADLASPANRAKAVEDAVEEAVSAFVSGCDDAWAGKFSQNLAAARPGSYYARGRSYAECAAAIAIRDGESFRAGCLNAWAGRPAPAGASIAYQRGCEFADYVRTGRGSDDPAAALQPHFEVLEIFRQGVAHGFDSDELLSGCRPETPLLCAVYDRGLALGRRLAGEEAMRRSEAAAGPVACAAVDAFLAGVRDHCRGRTGSPPAGTAALHYDRGRKFGSGIREASYRALADVCDAQLLPTAPPPK